MLPVLRRTYSLFHATAQRYAPHALPPGREMSSSAVFSSQLSLPIPEPLVDQLIMLGVDNLSAERISSVMMRATSRLKRSFEMDFYRRLEKLRCQAQYFEGSKFSTTFPSTYLIIYTKTIQSWRDHLLNDVTPRVIRAQTLHQRNPSSAHPRRSFNQDAIPILERFFSDNAFPTRLEKYDLAHKCAMEFKQIHVWFQNRRSRFRKEGKDLRRPHKDAILLHLEDSAVDAMLPECDCIAESPVRPVSPTPPSPVDVFQYDPPAHVFPTPYPPLCSEDPFPSNPSVALPWIRKASSSIRAALPVISISELTAAFANLSVTGEDVKRSLPDSSIRPWFEVGLCTRCPSAPHPSFIGQRAVSPPPASPPKGLQAVASPLGDQLSPDCPSPSLGRKQDLGLAPSSVPSRRIKKSLPRRVPKHPPSYRESSENGSPHSAHRKLSPSSRLSSWSSSDSLISSDPDSPLSTPPQRPVDLVPSIRVSALSYSGDLAGHNLDFSDEIKALTRSSFTRFFDIEKYLIYDQS